MQNNPYNKIKNNLIMTASPAELTLMLYEGAIKFGNQAITAINAKDIGEAHRLIVRVQDIIDELRGTLNFDFPIAEQMDRMYEFISFTLVEANIEKSAEKVETALIFIREFRDTWKEAMALSRK